jgi:hypothetical protein
MSGEESAIFKGLAGDADKALGDAGGALGSFTEKTAQTADETTDRILSTESGNVEDSRTSSRRARPHRLRGRAAPRRARSRTFSARRAGDRAAVRGRARTGCT